MNYRTALLLPHGPGVDRPVVYEGMRTPWGDAQDAEVMLPGIGFVSTAGHGGIKLDSTRNRMVPEYMRTKGGWYEEDCEWAIPFCVFEAEIAKDAREHLRKAITEGDHKRTLANWFPDAYQRFYGVTLDRSQSLILDQKLFQQENVNNYVVVCAFGDWKEGVPKGMVGVAATLGGRRDNDSKERWFLVPAEEYSGYRSHNGFVVNPSKHQEIQPL